MPVEVVPPVSGCSEHSSRATTLRGRVSAIPSFFEIKEAGGVCALSEKNRIVVF
jgi:hypothetical protein